jgi:hypothetical protein
VVHALDLAIRRTLAQRSFTVNSDGQVEVFQAPDRTSVTLSDLMRVVIVGKHTYQALSWHGPHVEQWGESPTTVLLSGFCGIRLVRCKTAYVIYDPGYRCGLLGS